MQTGRDANPKKMAKIYVLGFEINWSKKSTGVGSGELCTHACIQLALENSPKKARTRVPTAFLVLPNFHSCLYNSIETRYMFSIS